MKCNITEAIKLMLTQSDLYLIDDFNDATDTAIVRWY